MMHATHMNSWLLTKWEFSTAKEYLFLYRNGSSSHVTFVRGYLVFELGRMRESGFPMVNDRGKGAFGKVL